MPGQGVTSTFTFGRIRCLVGHPWRRNIPHELITRRRLEKNDVDGQLKIGCISSRSNDYFQKPVINFNLKHHGRADALLIAGLRGRQLRIEPVDKCLTMPHL